jgi:uncharacterized protein with HEPN domain
MSERREEIPLLHMLDHAREAMLLAKDRTRADLDSDRLLELVRLLEIAGEAANRVSLGIRAMYPDIPWPQIVALRNRLIHGYDAVDLDILWQIVVQDLPPLVAALEGILAGYDAQQAE